MNLPGDARAFAECHRIGHLATADAAASPHVVPLCYALLGDHLYFGVDEKPTRSRSLKRLRNIAENPRVALIIDEYDEEWTKLAFLLIHGQAARVNDAEEYAKALRALRERYPQYRAMPLAFERHPMVRITPEHVHLWRAADQGAA